MRRHICTLIFALCLAFGQVFAHQDFFVTKDFGNVKVRIKTGFKYEEINKVLIFGQLAKHLADKLNYSEQILLDFNHHYVGNCNPDFFISYDKGNIEYTWDTNSSKKDFLKDNAIVIRQVARQFDARTTLKLLENAILNIKSIKSNQKQIEYKKNYCEWKINSIDAHAIKKILDTPTDKLLNGILNLRIDRPEEDFKSGFLYYWKNNKYFIFLKEYGKPETILTEIENIYDFKRLGNSSAIIFDSDRSFYYVNSSTGSLLSQRHIIKNASEYYEPFEVKNIGEDKISINFWYYSKEIAGQFRTIEETLIYLTQKDELIQNPE